MNLKDLSKEDGFSDEEKRQEKRRQFFLNLLAWGKVTKETRLIMVGVRDGGPPWTEDLTPLQVDKRIEGCQLAADPHILAKMQRYIVPPTTCRESPGRTELVQCRLALEMRGVFGLPPLAMDAATYFHSAFQKGFELTANVHCLSRRTEAASMALWLDYLGFASSRALATVARHNMQYRLDGIRQLGAALAVDGRRVVLLFMGVPSIWHMIQAHFELTDADKTVVLKGSSTEASVFKQGQLALCFFRHPRCWGFSQGSACLLAQKLSSVILS